jgi:hypothetical protein
MRGLLSQPPSPGIAILGGSLLAVALWAASSSVGRTLLSGSHQKGGHCSFSICGYAPAGWPPASAAEPHSGHRSPDARKSYPHTKHRPSERLRRDRYHIRNPTKATRPNAAAGSAGDIVKAVIPIVLAVCPSLTGTVVDTHPKPQRVFEGSGPTDSPVCHPDSYMSGKVFVSLTNWMLPRTVSTQTEWSRLSRSISTSWRWWPLIQRAANNVAAAIAKTATESHSRVVGGNVRLRDITYYSPAPRSRQRARRQKGGTASS